MRLSSDRRSTYELDAIPEVFELMNDDNKHVESIIKWSGDLPIPAIGQDVMVYMNSLGGGTVTGYFIEFGFLGIYVKLNPKTRPAWHKKQNPDKDFCMVFGNELKPFNK